jgi:hypothetical protein
MNQNTLKESPKADKDYLRSYRIPSSRRRTGMFQMREELPQQPCSEHSV